GVGGGMVMEILTIDLGVLQIRPGRLLQREPTAIGLEPPVEQPQRLILLRRDEADHLLGETLGGLDRFDVGEEAVFVLVDVDLANASDCLLHCRHVSTPNSFVSFAAYAASCRRRTPLITSLQA